jgi:hypothetical protein
MSNAPDDNSSGTTGQNVSADAGKVAPKAASKTAVKTMAEIRDDRLKSALKANMAKRKMQTRARKVSTHKNNQAE